MYNTLKEAGNGSLLKSCRSLPSPSGGENWGQGAELRPSLAAQSQFLGGGVGVLEDGWMLESQICIKNLCKPSRSSIISRICFFSPFEGFPLAEDGKNGREGGGMNLLTRTAVSGQVPDKQL